MVNSKPKIILSAAITLDGKIGQKNKHIVLSSKSDKIRVHKLRAKSDAILVGKNTVQQDDPLLTVRYAKGNNPIRIILDSNGTIKNDSRIIKTCKRISTIIVVSELASKSNSKVAYISNDTEEGTQLLLGFGGLAAILRYPMM